MKFRNRPKIKFKVKVRGLFSASIPYQVNVADGNWRPYEGQYEPQRWGIFDSDSCWAISMVRSVEMQLNQMWPTLPQTHKDFLTQNGYAGTDGIERMSERFIEILGGNKDNGGTSPEAWQLAQDYGLIPRSMLSFSEAQANTCASEPVFEAVYFDPNAVTQPMKDLGQKFLTYFSIQFQNIGTQPDLITLQTKSRQAPLNLGVPIPVDVSQWNNQTVVYQGNETPPAHEIVGVNFPTKTTVWIADQYQPEDKDLVNCPLPFVHQGVITPIDLTVKKKLSLISHLLTALATLLGLDKLWLSQNTKQGR